jgi:hypothetical protein
MLHNIKAVNGTSFPLQLGQDIIFEVPALGNGYYCDFSTSYFRMNVKCTYDTALAYTTGSAGTNDGYLRFERGPESMFRRIQIFDASGNLLENFENYNDMYALTELLTNNHANRRGVSTFHGEGFFNPIDSEYTEGRSGTATVSAQRVLPVCYSDLGGAIIAQRFGDTATAAGAAQARQACKSGAFNLQLTAGTEFSNKQYQMGVRPVTFQLMSSLFGGASDKYLPMSAINGMRIIFSLENVIGSLVRYGLGGMQPYRHNRRPYPLHEHGTCGSYRGCCASFCCDWT